MSSDYRRLDRKATLIFVDLVGGDIVEVSRHSIWCKVLAPSTAFTSYDGAPPDIGGLSKQTARITLRWRSDLESGHGIEIEVEGVRWQTEGPASYPDRRRTAILRLPTDT